MFVEWNLHIDFGHRIRRCSIAISVGNFEVIGIKWLSSWEGGVCPGETWIELLHIASSTKDKETIEFSKDLLEKRCEEVSKTGCVSPRKRLMTEAGFPEGDKFKDKTAWEKFDHMHESSQDASEFFSDLVKGLQYKVNFLSKKLRSTPLKVIYQDTERLNHKVSALSNKVGFHLPDTEPRTVMEHVAHLGFKIDAVNNIL